MPEHHPAGRSIELIARGVLRHGASVLVCRNLKRGYLYLPGGHVEFGEPAAAAAEREFMEETGLMVRAGPCVLVSEGRFEARGKPHHEINLVFPVEHLPGVHGADGADSDPVAPASAADTAPAGGGVPRGTPPLPSPRGSGVFPEEHPPAVVSREAGIGFEWVDLASVADLDLRPDAIRAWLASGGRADPGAACTWVPSRT